MKSAYWRLDSYVTYSRLLVWTRDLQSGRQSFALLTLLLVSSAMPDCCRCNGLGTCRRCSCAKAGRLCENCLPGRRGLCVNQPTLSTIVSDTPPVSLPAGQSENEPRATCTVAEPQLSSSPVPTTLSTSQPIHQQSPIQPVVLQPTITLPVSPSNEASFTLLNPLTPIRATVFLTPTDETLTVDSSFSSVPSIPAPSITPVLGVDSSPAPSITPALGIDNFDLPPFIPIDIAKAFTWGSIQMVFPLLRI